MFNTFTQLRRCAHRQNFPLSAESLDILLDFFQQKSTARDFIDSLDVPNFDRDTPGIALSNGTYGAVYDDAEGNAIKIYRDEDGSLYIDEDSERLKSFVENIMFYVLFKTILSEAYRRGFTKMNLSLYILDINKVFSDTFDDDTVFIGYTSKLHKNKWTEDVSTEIYSVLKEINSLNQHGIYLVHGDLKTPNIVVTDNNEPRIIDFDIASVHIEFGKQRAMRYTGDTVKSISDGTNAIDFNVVDLVMFACRYEVIDKNFERLNKIGKIGNFTDDFYYIAYDKFSAKNFKFDSIMECLELQ